MGGNDKILGFGLSLLGFLTLCASPAAAGQASANFTVTATVLDNCTVSASDLAFGNYNASAGSPTNANTTLSVVCTNGLDYTVALDGGTTTHSAAARAMKDTASDNLSYGLYTGSDYGTLWGDASGGTVKLSCGLGLFVLPDVSVSLSGGNSADVSARRLDKSANDHLGYNIYTGSGHGTVWGDGSAGSQFQSLSGSLLGLGNFTFTGYGLVPAGQYVAAGGYSDHLTVLVTF